MNWRLKAQLQNLIAAFPSDFSYELYFFLQRHFGGLRTVNPISRFQAGIAVMERLRRQRRERVQPRLPLHHGLHLLAHQHHRLILQALPGDLQPRLEPRARPQALDSRAHWHRHLAELATCPNVMVKIGGMGVPRCGFGQGRGGDEWCGDLRAFRHGWPYCQNYRILLKRPTA